MEPTEVERLVRIETKLDNVVEITAQRGIDHENRLRSIEQKVWFYMGMSAVSGGSAGYIVQALAAR